MKGCRMATAFPAARVFASRCRVRWIVPQRFAALSAIRPSKGVILKVSCMPIAVSPRMRIAAASYAVTVRRIRASNAANRACRIARPAAAVQAVFARLIAATARRTRESNAANRDLAVRRARLAQAANVQRRLRLAATARKIRARNAASRDWAVQPISFVRVQLRVVVRVR